MTRLDLIDARPLGARLPAKGWCPGAHRPMASGDGLLVRIRPRLARLTIEQATGLCDLAQRLGSGFIDLTNRANLQLRGVLPSDHAAVIDALCRLNLLDADATREKWPAILVAPFWQAGDDTEHIATELAARLGELPALPPKFGFAVDTGPRPVLGAASADVRIERASSGGLIVRADGAPAGHPVTRADAVNASLAMAAWFAATAGSAEPASKRMKLHLDKHALPHPLRPLEPAAPTTMLPSPGMSRLGPVYGVAFGQIEATALVRLLQDSGAAALRLIPHRALILEGGAWRESSDFLTAADDPLLHIDACPGAPSCASATVSTRDVARRVAREIAINIAKGGAIDVDIEVARERARELSRQVARAVAAKAAHAVTSTPQPTAAIATHRSVHVSGCAKGCARARTADLTLVGRDGAFDLVRDGCAWDAPSQTGLSPEALRSFIGTP